MNQYLNPAAKLSVGGLDYVNVKTYGNLASETNATSLLNGLASYTRWDVSTLIFNLPMDAFKSKDWWQDGGQLRAGLIPTQTGCVNHVNKNGEMFNSEATGKDGNKFIAGMIGPQGERFDGALTIQIIKPNTPATALELNGPDVRYGWRVKWNKFSEYVLAEYTTFWHHPNKACYGDDNWVPDPPEDFEFTAGAEVPAAGSADPRDGIFGAGLSSVTVVTTVDNVTTTTRTYSDDSDYVKRITTHDDGSVTIYQRFRDGTEETIVLNTVGGVAGYIDPNVGSPEEELSTTTTGRQAWRDTTEYDY
jgi:hypothetical protein